MLLVQKSLLAILALRRGNDRAAGVRSRANISFGRQGEGGTRIKCSSWNLFRKSVHGATPGAASLMSARSALKMGGAGVAYIGGMIATYEFTRPKPPLPSCSARCCTFAKLSEDYDKEIERDEASSGIIALREELAKRARGRVLEVAAGTGRNLPFYTSAATELTIADSCKEMLGVAAQKIARMRAEHAERDRPCISNVTLAVMDASSLPVADGSYDTVVDTFGICSFEDPERALREMSRCCQADGEVLLLEHGASWMPLLRWWQNHKLNRHVEKWGCYWNRDIEGIVERSGLRVKQIQRKHLGTTMLIRCAPAEREAVEPAAEPSASTAAA